MYCTVGIDVLCCMLYKARKKAGKKEREKIFGVG
jgi:hypothetical protein